MTVFEPFLDFIPLERQDVCLQQVSDKKFSFIIKPILCVEVMATRKF